MGLTSFLSRLLTGAPKDEEPSCAHLDMVQVLTTEQEGCEECLTQDASDPEVAKDECWHQLDALTLTRQGLVKPSRIEPR